MKRPTHTDPFTGVFIPRIALEDNRLSAAERILYGCVAGLSRSDRGCFASSGYLASICGIKPRQLRNLLGRLEGLGLIQRLYLGGRQRLIRVTAPEALEANPPEQPRRQSIAMGGGNLLPPYRIEDKLKYPPTPLEGGNRVRRRNIKMTTEGYTHGF